MRFFFEIEEANTDFQFNFFFFFEIKILPNTDRLVDGGGCLCKSISFLSRLSINLYREKLNKLVVFKATVLEKMHSQLIIELV